jgi:hypothetical protein
MAIAKKVTASNHLPGEGDARFPVYSKQFNELVDTVLELEATDGDLTVTDLTASGAVVFSGIETIAAGGTTTAADLTKSLHSVDADAGGDIVTLADGTIGQIMTFVCVSATGVLTLTPANLAGGTSVTMNAAGESVILQFVDTQWYIMGGNAYTVI